MSKRTLLLLSYGTEAAQIHETTFAVLSAWRAVQGDDIRMVLYTDQADTFPELPVEIRPITATELEVWTGSDGYQHRRKACALRDALQSFPGAVVFLDSDIWFRRPARYLFDRIGPRQSVMHLEEGRLSESDHAPKHALGRYLADAALTDANGRLIDINAPMWNSGVVGLHSADAYLVDEAICLIDEVWPRYQASSNLEQFAISQFLYRDTRIMAAHDVVYHYWPASVRAPFREQLPDLLRATESLPLVERVEALHRWRPRLHGVRRAKFTAKQVYRALGRRTAIVPSSAT